MTGIANILKQFDETVYARYARVLFNRSKRSMDGCTITPEYIEQLFVRQEGRCLYTGRKFTLDGIEGSRTKPYVPSLDRINPSLGYVPGNVRLVTWQVNRALSDLGDDALDQLVRDRMNMPAFESQASGAEVCTPTDAATAQVTPPPRAA